MYAIRTENNILETIRIESCYYVNDIIKDFSDKYSISNQRLPYSELIYEKIILNREKPLQFYKICSKKEIYMGSLEGYISRFGDKEQDVIVEVVIQCILSESIFLIMKTNDKISKVKDILTELTEISDFPEIFDINGAPLEIETPITWILTKDLKQKIFISWTPDYLHEGYNRSLIEKYFWFRGNSKGWIKSFDKTIKIIKKDFLAFKKHLKSHPKDSLIPNIKLSKELFRISKPYFCKWYSERFYEECEEEWKAKINKNDFNEIYYFIRIAIFIVLHEECNWSPTMTNCWHKIDSFRDILIEALTLLLKENSGTFIIKKYIKHVFIGEITREILEKEIKNYFLKYGVIKIKMRKSTEILRIPLREISLSQLKKVAHISCGIDEDLLYFVNYDEQDLSIPIKVTENMTIHLEEMKRLDENQIIKFIGGGDSGDIYLCKEAGSNEEFAIKIFKDSAESVREININEEIKPLNLFPKYRGLMIYEGQICAAFSLYKESLDDKIKLAGKNPYCQQSVISEQKIIKWTYEILKELKELHKWGIIHRDIKPANILLDENERATLCDYGCSKLICNETNDNILSKMNEYLAGTLDYMAPELLEDVPYSNKTDIWSLGIVIIEMIEGKLSNNIKRKIIDLELLRCKSESLKKLLEKCLKTDPSQRSSAEELLEMNVFETH